MVEVVCSAGLWLRVVMVVVVMMIEIFSVGEGWVYIEFGGEIIHTKYCLMILRTYSRSY